MVTRFFAFCFFSYNPNQTTYDKIFLLSLKMLLKVISLQGQLQQRQIANHYSKVNIYCEFNSLTNKINHLVKKLPVGLFLQISQSRETSENSYSGGGGYQHIYTREKYTGDTVSRTWQQIFLLVQPEHCYICASINSGSFL